jgi:hypothetical protein
MKRPRFTLSDCVFEERIAGGLALYDASHLMPRREEKRRKRDPSKVRLLFVHHSGALGRPGVDGAWASANYMVNQKKRRNGTLLKAPGLRPVETSQYWFSPHSATSAPPDAKQ